MNSLLWISESRRLRRLVKLQKKRQEETCNFVLQHCCTTGWIAFATHVRTCLATKRLQRFFVGGKTGNVAVHLVLQQCYKTSYRLFCYRFYPTLNFISVGQHDHVADGLVWQFCPSCTCISNPAPWQCRQSCVTFWSFQLYWAEKKSRPYVESRKLSSTWPNTGNTGTEWLTYGIHVWIVNINHSHQDIAWENWNKNDPWLLQLG